MAIPPPLPTQAFVGSGGGGPNLIMQSSGLVNAFAHRENSWACVTYTDIIAANPDVMIIVETNWEGDSAQHKINLLHNHTGFCNTPFVQNADYIKIPFSATSPGPRNGVAAMDMVAAAIHVTTGETQMNFKSGVKAFDPQELAERTKNLVCPLQLEKVAYAKTTYTSCGVTHSLARVPERVVTMNQGATEFMFAMGLEDHMVGTAYLDDEIWPKYTEAYARIPVLSDIYPDESTIMGVNPDFIFATMKSAYTEGCGPKFGTTCCPTCYKRGIFAPNGTIGPCEGENSEYFPAGSSTAQNTVGYKTCRPQLHAAGIGTYLPADDCENAALRIDASRENVYTTITHLGTMFNVPQVASQLISEIQNDFIIAQQTLQASGHSFTAVWFDCLGCCDDPNLIMVGVGKGTHNLIMKEAGLVNMFADHPPSRPGGSYACVSGNNVLNPGGTQKDPDVLILVDATWSSKLGKVDWLHNHSALCMARAVSRADYITIPFSASDLGPRNGAAALDMVSAIIHVTSGDTTMNFQSGVKVFDPQELAERTKNLRCPVQLKNLAYSGVSAPPPPPPPPFPSLPSSPSLPLQMAESKDDDVLPTWGIVLVAVVCLLFLLMFAAAFLMYRREKQGKPIFLTLEADKANKAAQQSRTSDTIKAEMQLNQA